MDLLTGRNNNGNLYGDMEYTRIDYELNNKKLSWSLRNTGPLVYPETSKNSLSRNSSLSKRMGITQRRKHRSRVSRKATERKQGALILITEKHTYKRMAGTYKIVEAIQRKI